MFEEFLGLPAHPLLLHVPVVLVPLLALLAAGYALVPLIRPHTRWVLGLLAVAAPVSALLAKLSGQAFFDRLDARGEITEGFYPVIENHQDLGNLTVYSTAVLGVLTLVVVYLVRPGEPVLATGGSGAGRARSLVLRGVTLVAAAASLYYVLRTGDSGANAVWGDS